MQIDLDYTPERIKKLRYNQRLTQVQLAELLGVTQAAISQWETGVSRPETVETLEKLYRLENS